MSDYDRRGVTPSKIVAALIGLGLLGRRGQSVLTLTRRGTKWGLLLCVVGFALTAYDGAEEDKLLMMGFFLGAFVCGAVWCYAAFAQWLTHEDEEPRDGGAVLQRKMMRSVRRRTGAQGPAIQCQRSADQMADSAKAAQLGTAGQPARRRF